MNEESLQCKFCLNLFADPVFLHCGHSICKLCVDNLYSFKLLNALSNDAPSLKPTAQASATTTTSPQPEAATVGVQCPTCSQETKLGVNEGTSQLKISFELKTLVEEYSASQKKEVMCENECTNKADIHCTACGFLCNSCYSSIHTSAVSKKHPTQAVSKGTKQLQAVERGNCKKHNKELELYCRTDDSLCCSLCYIFGDHKGHDCLPASDYTQECKEKVNTAKKELKGKLNVFNTTAKELEQTALKVQKNHAEVEAKIQDTFQELHKALSKREAELLAVSKKMQQDKQGLLSQQVKSLKTVATASEQLLHETVTEDENAITRLALLHKILTQQVASCSTALEGQMRPCVSIVTRADIDCSSLLKSIADFGSVTSVLPPQKILNVAARRQENAVEVSWDKDENATEYIIEIAAEESKEFTVAGTTKDCRIKLQNLNFQARYTIRVSGRNEAGKGEISDMKEVQLASQRVLIKCWGAGGASGYCNYGNYGGAGGFIQAHYEMQFGEELKIVVGQGGRWHNGSYNEKISRGYPNGGHGNHANYNSGGGGGSSHVISSIHNCVILGAGGGGGASGGLQYGAGGGGGGGTYNGLVGTGGNGGYWNNNGTNGTLGGGAGGAYSTGYGNDLPGTSDLGGSGGKTGCNGESRNGAGGSAGTRGNPGGGGGGGACSFKHIVENSQVIINATTHTPVNTTDADYDKNAGAGATKAKEDGQNGRVAIIDEQGKKYIFSSDATFRLQ